MPHREATPVAGCGLGRTGDEYDFYSAFERLRVVDERGRRHAAP